MRWLLISCPGSRTSASTTLDFNLGPRGVSGVDVDEDGGRGSAREYADDGLDCEADVVSAASSKTSYTVNEPSNTLCTVVTYTFTIGAVCTRELRSGIGICHPGRHST